MPNSNTAFNDLNLQESTTYIDIIAGQRSGSRFILENMSTNFATKKLTLNDIDGSEHGKLNKKVTLEGNGTLRSYNSMSVNPDIGDQFIMPAVYGSTGSAYTCSLDDVKASKSIGELWSWEVNWSAVPSKLVF